MITIYKEDYLKAITEAEASALPQRKKLGRLVS
jgi:hypothetical protein